MNKIVWCDKIKVLDAFFRGGLIKITLSNKVAMLSIFAKEMR